MCTILLVMCYFFSILCLLLPDWWNKVVYIKAPVHLWTRLLRLVTPARRLPDVGNLSFCSVVCLFAGNSPRIVNSALTSVRERPRRPRRWRRRRRRCRVADRLRRHRRLVSRGCACSSDRQLSHDESPRHAFRFSAPSVGNLPSISKFRLKTFFVTRLLLNPHRQRSASEVTTARLYRNLIIIIIIIIIIHLWSLMDANL